MTKYSNNDYLFAVHKSEMVFDRFAEILAEQRYVESLYCGYISLDDIGVCSRSELIESLLLSIAHNLYLCLDLLSHKRDSDKPKAEAHLNIIDILSDQIFQIKMGTLRCHNNLELSLLKSSKGDKSDEYEAFKSLRAIAAADNLMENFEDTGKIYDRLQSLPIDEHYYPQAFRLLNIDPINFAKERRKKSVFERILLKFKG